MTQNEFDSYVLNVVYIFAENTYKYALKVAVGKEKQLLDVEFGNLFLQKIYCNLIVNYTILSEGVEDTVNKVTVDEMVYISKKLNILQGTNFAPNFILTPEIAP
jgi:hypothetical protein